MVDVLLRWVSLFRAKAHLLSASSPSDVEESLRTLGQKTQLVAALLRAGISPADASEFSGVNLHSRAQAGTSSPEAFLIEVWNFASESGAAPATLLEVCAQAFAEASEIARQARIQLAGPQAATNLVMTLPLLALAGGYLAGYNPLGFLLGSIVGWAVILGATALMVLSHRWSHRMVVHSQRWEWFRGMPTEAMAMSLSAGQSLSQAHSWAMSISHQFSENQGIAQQELARCAEFVVLARKTGVGLASLLRSQAQRERQASREDAQMRVEKLSVRLMIPLGVCVLPAFIAVGILPLVASVISSTALNF